MCKRTVPTITLSSSHIRENAAVAGAAIFFYNNSFEAIGHCLEFFFGNGFFVDNLLLMIFSIVFTIPFALSFLQIKSKYGFGMLSFIIIVVFLSLMRNPSLWIYMKPHIGRIFLCWIVFVIFQYIEIESFYKKVVCQKWIFLLLFVVSYFLLRQESYMDSAKQVIAYNIATIAILFFIEFSRGQNAWEKISNLFAFIGLLLLAFGMSSRGAIVSIVLAVGLFITVSYRLFIPVVLGAIIMILNLSSIFEFLSSTLSLFGIDSRIVSYLSINKFFAQEGRGIIYSSMIKALENNNIFGAGIFSDRLYLSETIGLDTYSHNFILEILYEFGWFGGVLILFITALLLGCVLFKKDTNELTKAVVCMFFVRGIVCLIFSGSYITTYEFFIILALGIQTLRKKPYIKKLFKHTMIQTEKSGNTISV